MRRNIFMKNFLLPSPSSSPVVFHHQEYDTMAELHHIDKIVKLLLADRERELTDAERSELQEWLKEDPGHQALIDSLSKEEHIESKLKELFSYDRDKAYSRFLKKVNVGRSFRIPHLLRYAALLIPFFFALYFIYQQNMKEKAVSEMTSEIQPGTSKALLELTDGTVVNLEVEEKVIEEYDGTLVQNTRNQLTYKQAGKRHASGEKQFNTLKIPRGGEYLLTCSDGTKIWLNSETTLKYPIVFSKASRDVYLEGEAFFEVAENSNWPFVVHVSGVKVQVLGTSFNIRAYRDEEASTTTLVTGRVHVEDSGSEKEFHLTPNEQAVVSPQGTEIRKVDINPFIAWKNGRILFEGNELEDIFKDLSRWYNVEVSYADEEVKGLKFNIDIRRYSDFDTILEILELTKKVKFEIYGNKVIIGKNS